LWQPNPFVKIGGLKWAEKAAKAGLSVATCYRQVLPLMCSASRLLCRALIVSMILVLLAGNAQATDFYELQIYTVDTAPEGQLFFEVHSNSVVAATGESSKNNLPLYQFHNTFEFTYGLLPFVEIGQYICTSRFPNDGYQYAGGRSKVHFGIPLTESWPVQFGGNIEFQYMRRAAVNDPLNVEFMPIVQASFWGFFFAANPAIEKQFSGPGTHAGLSFEPQAQLSYRFHREWSWFEPSLEYFGEQGPFTNFYPIAQQQEFIVPAVNLYLANRLEFNFGFGFGLTRDWNGRFIKGTIGWLF
jgi:hypothetical protein